MSKQTTDSDAITYLLVAARILAQMDHPELRPVVCSAVEALERIYGPLDNETIDDWKKSTYVLIPQGFVDATPGYYESLRAR